MGIKGRPWERKILITAIVIVMTMSLASCTKTKEDKPVPKLEPAGVEHIETENIQTENIITETIEVETIIEEEIVEEEIEPEIWISEEYLKELEFNSQKNPWVS